MKEESKEIISYKIDNKPRMLKSDEIECRVGTINGKGCSLLLYKDARVDMKILDETYGVGNWQRTHEVINDNLFCTIEVWNDRICQWVKKQDVGTESYTEKEKGEASDSFKRAGFNVGIGRELYTSPFIWIMPKATMKPYNTKDIDGNEANEFYGYKKDNYGKLVYTTKTTFKVTEIGYDEENKINKLTIKDNKGNVRFQLLTPKEQARILDLMDQMKDLLEETNTDREKLYSFYKVSSNGEMTLEQLEDAVDKLKKKVGE
jgi:hypothetical protein